MAWNVKTSTTVVTPDLEIFKFPPNDQGFASVVLDASSVAPNEDGDRVLKAGTLISKNANNQYERYTAGGAVNDVTTLELTATGGTYNLTAAADGGDGETLTTADIAFDAVAATIKAALEALDNITTVTVTGTNPFTITVTDPANEMFVIDVVTTDLTGGSATVTAGTEGDIAQAIKGVLAHTVYFVDGTSKSDQPAAMAFHSEVFRADRIIDFATYAAAARAAMPTCRFD